MLAPLCRCDRLEQMCGRSSLHDAPTNILERFRLPPAIPGFKPRYNVAPTHEQWTLGVDASGAPEVRPRRWGLVPHWATDATIGARMINARAESLLEKPAFREAVERRRCIVLADGYYEWSGTGKSKIPMFFHMTGHEAFALAGLWERWDGGASPLETCTVVTTDASSKTSAWHPRMPAILDLDAAERWVSGFTPVEAALGLLVPYERADLECYEVSKLVNSPANDSSDCMLPVEESFRDTVRQLSLLD